MKTLVSCFFFVSTPALVSFPLTKILDPRLTADVYGNLQEMTVKTLSTSPQHSCTITGRHDPGSTNSAWNYDSLRFDPGTVLMRHGFRTGDLLKSSIEEKWDSIGLFLRRNDADLHQTTVLQKFQWFIEIRSVFFFSVVFLWVKKRNFCVDEFLFFFSGPFSLS